MTYKKDQCKEKLPYEEPKILATYQREDLEEAIMPHGESAGGCGCGGGSILIN
jgi:hypothetical protein